MNVGQLGHNVLVRFRRPSFTQRGGRILTNPCCFVTVCGCTCAQHMGGGIESTFTCPDILDLIIWFNLVGCVNPLVCYILTNITYVSQVFFQCVGKSTMSTNAQEARFELALIVSLQMTGKKMHMFGSREI